MPSDETPAATEPCPLCGDVGQLEVRGKLVDGSTLQVECPACLRGRLEAALADNELLREQTKLQPDNLYRQVFDDKPYEVQCGLGKFELTQPKTIRNAMDAAGESSHLAVDVIAALVWQVSLADDRSRFVCQGSQRQAGELYQLRQQLQEARDLFLEGDMYATEQALCRVPKSP